MKYRNYAFAGTVAAATLAVVSLHAQGAPMTASGAKDPTRVTAGNYAADPNHSMVEWRVNHFGFNDYMGLFGDVTGTLQIDPANLAATKVDVTIPVASVTLPSAALRDHLLRPAKDGAKPDFFGPNPAAARFVSTTVVVDKDGTEATVSGLLTLNGITKPVTLDVEFEGAGTNPMSKKQTIGFEGETMIRRSEFGVNYGIPIVSDQVELEISVAFEKQG